MGERAHLSLASYRAGCCLVPFHHLLRREELSNVWTARTKRLKWIRLEPGAQWFPYGLESKRTCKCGTAYRRVELHRQLHKVAAIQPGTLDGLPKQTNHAGFLRFNGGFSPGDLRPTLLRFDPCPQVLRGEHVTDWMPRSLLLGISFWS